MTVHSFLDGFSALSSVFSRAFKGKKTKLRIRGGGWGGEGKVRVGIWVMWRGSLLPCPEIHSSREGSKVEVVFMLHNHGRVMAIIGFSSSRINMAILHPVHFLKAYLRM